MPRSRSARSFVLAANDVHVWRFALDRGDWRASPARADLVDGEVAWARRFHFEDDQRRFVVCRANVRMILSRYVQCRPAEVVFRTGAHGKPFLDPGIHGTRVRFNVAHSHELALVAVTAAREVGVDIERVRHLDDIDAIAARHFRSQEQRALARASPSDRLSTFFACWTLTEAYLKAVGVGLNGPFEAGRDDAWTMRPLSAGPGYVAALAVEGRDLRLRLEDWRA
jgi:4'-phosphopantetheinyl transferase